MKVLGELEAAGHVGTERFKRWWSSLQLVFALCNRFGFFFLLFAQFICLCVNHLELSLDLLRELLLLHLIQSLQVFGFISSGLLLTCSNDDVRSIGTI